MDLLLKVCYKIIHLKNLFLISDIFIYIYINNKNKFKLLYEIIIFIKN